jgi:hypothetical protein
MDSGFVDDTEAGSIRHKAEGDIATSPSGKLGITDECRIFRSVTKITLQAEDPDLT